MFRKVVIGISGGVDSAVSAFLLKNKGFNVSAIFMKNWDVFDETGVCSLEKDWIDAQQVCDQLRIPIQKVDFVKQYWNDVFGNFLSDYQNGETPNPDIDCNKYIKFNAFYHYARENLFADAISTGHYAQTSFGTFLENFRPDENVKLLRATDGVKDQTFFLSQIPQISLRRTMFPVGCLYKNVVKKLATEVGLASIAQKKESMGICFVGKRNFKEFMSEYIAPKPGTFIDFDTGKVLGKHNGIHHYTVGQGIKLGGMKMKMYVLEKMADNETILVAGGTNNPAFYSQTVYTESPHWIDKSPFESTNLNKVKNLKYCFQHIDPLVNCSIAQSHNGLLVELEKPLRAITPGQYAVFYRDNECLGSAKIQTALRSVKCNDSIKTNSLDDKNGNKSNRDEREQKVKHTREHIS